MIMIIIIETGTLLYLFFHGNIYFKATQKCKFTKIFGKKCSAYSYKIFEENGNNPIRN